MSSLDHHHRFRRRSLNVISFSTLDLFWSFFLPVGVHFIATLRVVSDTFYTHIINCHFTSKCVIYVHLIKILLVTFQNAVPFLTTQSTLLLRFLTMAFMLILADLQIFLSSAYAPVVLVIRTSKPRMFFWDYFTT